MVGRKAKSLHIKFKMQSILTYNINLSFFLFIAVRFYYVTLYVMIRMNEDFDVVNKIISEVSKIIIAK